jgi:hypothetical protein
MSMIDPRLLLFSNIKQKYFAACLFWKDILQTFYNRVIGYIGKQLYEQKSTLLYFW